MRGEGILCGVNRKVKVMNVYARGHLRVSPLYGKKINKTMQFKIVWACKKILKGETNNERNSAHGAKY